MVVIETAELLTTELVTNVVVHVAGTVDLVVRTIVRGVRVEVTDHDRRLPKFGAAEPDAVGGRGLVLVDALADAWGVDHMSGNGKTIWFELESSPSP